MRVGFTDQRKRRHRPRNQLIAFVPLVRDLFLSFFLSPDSFRILFPLQYFASHASKMETKSIACVKKRRKDESSPPRLARCFQLIVSLVDSERGRLSDPKTCSMERVVAGSNAKLGSGYENYICIPRTFYPIGDWGKNPNRNFDNALTDFEERALCRWTGRNVI